MGNSPATGRSTADSTSARRRCAPAHFSGRRDQHLRSADFFDVERYPEISVVVTALQPTTGNAAELRASFTVKGINEPVPLPVRVAELNDGSVRISGETKVDRAQFGLGWNKLGVMSATATIAADTIFVRATR